MKKIIRLTESDLARIVKRILNEISHPEGVEMPEVPTPEYEEILANLETGNEEDKNQQLTESRGVHKKKFKLTEREISKIAESVLNRRNLLKEGQLTNSVVDTMYSAHPGHIYGYDFFPQIIPQQYEATKDLPGYWANACASKVSMALHVAGYNTPGPYYTDVVWKGVPKGSRFTAKASSMVKVLTDFFGQPEVINLPTPIDPNTQYNAIPEKMKGRKGVYVISGGFGEGVSGHADVWNGSTSKGIDENDPNASYFGLTATLYFWGAPTQVETNAKKCGWGNDTVGYKKSGWKCYDEEMAQGKSYPAKNAKKCGWKDDVKAYRESGWKCKN
jgi:hypothetical protein